MIVLVSQSTLVSEDSAVGIQPRWLSSLLHGCCLVEVMYELRRTRCGDWRLWAEGEAVCPAPTFEREI